MCNINVDIIIGVDVNNFFIASLRKGEGCYIEIKGYGTNMHVFYMVCENDETYQAEKNGRAKKTRQAEKAVQSHPFDDVFKTLKVEHTRLFIPVINTVFGTDYGLDERITLLPTEGNFIIPTREGTAEITERVTDFLVKLRSKCYLIECQSTDDNEMVIRLAEYAFLAGVRNAEMDDGVYTVTMPNYTVLYVRSNSATPRETRMTFIFPNGQKVEYNAPNILLADYNREEIVAKRLH